MTRIALLLLCCALQTVCVAQATAPQAIEGDVVVRNFRFKSNEALPELRLHYRTLGKLERDAQGRARNAVLIMHGTGGSGAHFLRPTSRIDYFGPGASWTPANISSCFPMASVTANPANPAMGLRAIFPRYGHLDMIEAQHQLSASQDYDPAPALEKIRASLAAINFADDLINPPELEILEREIKRVRAVRRSSSP